MTKNFNCVSSDLISKIYPLLWLLIFTLALAWRAQNLDAFGLSNDEGVYLMWGRLAAAGYRLYSQTYAVQPPLFLEWVALAFRLAGPTIEVGRWAILPSFGLLAAVLSWLAYRSGGWPAALTAVLLLSLSPLVFTFSRLVMAEIPATALAVISVALCFVFLDTERRGWLIASGLALGLNFLIKPLNPFVIVPVGLLLVNGQSHREAAHWSMVSGQRFSTLNLQAKHLISVTGRRWSFDLLLWGLGGVIPLAAVPLLYDPAAVYDQLIRFRGELRAAIPGSPAETLALFETFISSHWGFWLLAFGGIMAAVWRVWTLRKQQGSGGAGGQGRMSSSPCPLISSLLYPLTWIAWLIAGVVMLWWHTPLFPHHFVVLLPPLILLGAEFVGNWFSVLSCWPAVGGQRSAVILYSLIIIPAAFNIPALVKANNDTAAIVTGGREVEAIKLLQAVSNPDDFVLGDSQLLIFMADRRTPPPMGDIALVAIKAGRQTSERMIRLTEQYQAPAVAQWSLRLPWLPEYLDWVEANYLARRVWDNDHIIYFGRRILPGEAVPNQRLTRLGDAMALCGFQIDTDSLKPGQNLNLKVYWQTDAPPIRDYTVFTQLLDKNGALVASWDSQPLGGYFPTSQWPAREIVTDMVRLPVPAGLAPGDYTLITGMYLLDTLERLRIPDGGGDYLTLTTVRIE